MRKIIGYAISSMAMANAKSPLSVVQPTSLAEKLPEVEASMGNFGHITYGQTIIGKVVVPRGDNWHGCEPFKSADFPQLFKNDKDKHLNQAMALFIFVDRGMCSNPTKVRNIENFGGAVALIADNHEEDMQEFVMVDHSGNGHSLVTPGFMIDYK